MAAHDAPSPGLERIAAAFRHFGEAEAPANRSPIYERLSFVVAESPELCELASHTRPGQMPPNMLFAAVHFLLDEAPGDPLAAFYPSFGGQDSGDPGPAFADFCRRHRREIIPILQSRIVQTNEVRRSALLLPALATVAQEAGKPLALIEIGPSAGLNLLFDRYAYDYGDGLRGGDPASPVVLDCDSRATHAGDPARGVQRIPEVLLSRPPAIVSRCGIDLNPLDITDSADLRWLRALVWPDHDDRRKLLAAAAQLAKDDPPRLVAGDIYELLPSEVHRAAADGVVCIFATFVFPQFSYEMLTRLEALIATLSYEREIEVVTIASKSFGGVPRDPEPDIMTWLHSFSDGHRESRPLALCNPHGRWIEWGATAAQ